MFRRLSLFIAACILLASCEKAEEALVLPPPTGASHATVSLGPNYERQVFYDFETGSSVYVSDPGSWDLAFEASEDGKHVFMNGGKDIYVYNLGVRKMAKVVELPDNVSSSGFGWLYDEACGQPEGTGIGDWYGVAGATKAEVYLVRVASGVFNKMRILSSTATAFTIEWAPLESKDPPLTVEIAKDSAYNYVYYSFSKGVVKPEPPKSTWDVVFTRYRPLVYDNFTQVSVPYMVTGVLLNPSGTKAAADSISGFTAIDREKALGLTASTCRDVIGYDWKSIDMRNVGGHYTVDRSKTYILHTRKNQLFKLRFLDYYNSSGEKGHPLFEYERLL